VSPARLKLGRYFAETDTGRKRRGNEDTFVCAPPIFAVADGMGGAQAGELASGLAAATLREHGTDGGGPEHVEAMFREANRRVHERATTDATASGMGTTMTLAVVGADGRVTFGHVGDSRAYLLRGGRLEQLTNDHSLVAELVRRGELSPAEAELHPQRSVITRALGTDPDVVVDTFSLDPEPGDLLLICSDGLSSMVARQTLEQILNRFRANLGNATHALIQAANRQGGEDNITAVLFELTDSDGAVAVSEPEERTTEYPDEPEDADTLHPEDGVRLPPEVLAPVAAPADDTMVLNVNEIRSALAHDEEPEFVAGPGRRALALLVIIILIALIVLLVWRGLAS
jgi:protein phosphatase